MAAALAVVELATAAGGTAAVRGAAELEPVGFADGARGAAADAPGAARFAASPLSGVEKTRFLVGC